MTPIPPSCAVAIARPDSVTVSMAADTSGMFKVMSRVKRVLRDVSRGRMSEYAGTNKTSSNVSAFLIRRMYKLRAKIDYNVQGHISPPTHGRCGTSASTAYSRHEAYLPRPDRLRSTAQGPKTS